MKERGTKVTYWNYKEKRIVELKRQVLKNSKVLAKVNIKYYTDSDLENT